MDSNEKIQLDDITFDDVIGGDGVAVEDIAPPQEDEKQLESPEDPQEDILEDLPEEEESKDETEEVENELEEEEEEDKEEYEEDDDSDDAEDDTIVGAVLDKLGFELEEGSEYDDTTEGLVQMTKDMASTMADERIEEVLDKFPLVKQHLQYVLEGGESQKFMNAYDPNLDYNRFSLDEKDERSQKAVLGEYLSLKGHDGEFIKEMLEDFEDTGKLYNKAEAARKALGKYQESERSQLLEKQKEQNEANAKELQDFWDGVADTIEDSREFAGLRVTERDKSNFFNYLSRPVTQEGYTQRDLDHQKADMDVKLAIDYLMYKGFDLDTIINTKAKTRSARSLKDRIIKGEQSVKSARRASKRNVKFNIDDLDLNI